VKVYFLQADRLEPEFSEWRAMGNYLFHERVTTNRINYLTLKKRYGLGYVVQANKILQHYKTFKNNKLTDLQIIFLGLIFGVKAQSIEAEKCSTWKCRRSSLATLLMEGTIDFTHRNNSLIIGSAGL